ncbi:protein Aster-A-like isoform X2 [Schistocerca gregaria]|uniref:protein Aster-A-like isoform X2 n=1 Tax=Schistocerca gregaria TaxID=7010 RepID=UPI00211E0CEF|nr:protein Aster-A-like isoform X2 [Schistocerca gregaria]
MYKTESLADTPSVKHSLRSVVPKHRKDKEFKSLFQRQNDVLLDDYSCAYIVRSLIQHGRLYISDASIAFYSYILGRKTTLISFDEIIGVYKKNTVLLIPNAIEVVTYENKYYFASFVFRDQAFKLISSTWSSYVDRRTGDRQYRVVHSDKQGACLLFENKDNAMIQVLMGDAGGSEKVGDHLSGEKEPGALCEAEDALLDEQRAVEDSKETEQTDRIEKRENDRNICKKGKGTDDTYLGVDAIEPLVEENRIDAITAETLGVPENASCSHMSGSTKDYKNNLASIDYEDIPLTAFFEKMWMSRDFWIEHADQMNFANLELGDWKPSDPHCCLMRTLKYKVILSTPLGEKNAEVECQHYMNWQNGSLVVETFNVTNNIPVGNAFVVCERWQMTSKISHETSITHLELSMGIQWKKNVWGLKNTIKSKSIEGSSNSWETVKKLIEKTFRSFTEQQPQVFKSHEILPNRLVPLSPELPSIKKKPRHRRNSKSFNSGHFLHAIVSLPCVYIVLFFLSILVSIYLLYNFCCARSSSSDLTYQQHFLRLEQQLHDLDALVSTVLNLTSSSNDTRRPCVCSAPPT